MFFVVVVFVFPQWSSICWEFLNFPLSCSDGGGGGITTFTSRCL